MEILGERKISELPVVDAKGCPRGIIDVTDMVALLPEPKSAALPAAESPRVRIYPMDEYAD